MKFTAFAFMAATLVRGILSTTDSTMPKELPPRYINGTNINTVLLDAVEGGTIIQFLLDEDIFSDEDLTTVVGKITGFCSSTDISDPQPFYCSLSNIYPEGVIAYQGRGVIDGIEDPTFFVIVGGSGAYKNIKGTVTVTTLTPGGSVTEQVYELYPTDLVSAFLPLPHLCIGVACALFLLALQ